MFLPYLDVVLLIMSRNSTIASPRMRYLEIPEFVRSAATLLVNNCRLQKIDYSHATDLDNNINNIWDTFTYYFGLITSLYEILLLKFFFDEG